MNIITQILKLPFVVEVRKNGVTLTYKKEVQIIHPSEYEVESECIDVKYVYAPRYRRHLTQYELKALNAFHEEAKMHFPMRAKLTGDIEADKRAINGLKEKIEGFKEKYKTHSSPK